MISEARKWRRVGASMVKARVLALAAILLEIVLHRGELLALLP
jgi:hypothetical protein